MMDNGSADPIITVTLEPSDLEMPIVHHDSINRNLPKNVSSTSAEQKSLTSAKNFWIELPQLVVVETRFITQQIAAQRQIYSAQTLLPITDHNNAPSMRRMASPIATQTTPPPQLIDTSSLAKPEVVDAFMSTDSSNPCRDRAQQTTKPNNQTASIGIQCNLDDERVFDDLYSTSDASREKKADEKTEFLKFTREKCKFYINGRRECMVCGEVETSLKRMHMHLAIHWGPSVLCHICGLKFEHQALLMSHDCMLNSKKRRKTYQQCPIFWCGCVKNSPEALNEHIRKHLHMQRRRACVTFTLDRTLVIKRPVITNMNYLYRCNICLRRCKNSALFARHRKRCVERFVARMKGKDGESLLILGK